MLFTFCVLKILRPKTNTRNTATEGLKTIKGSKGSFLVQILNVNTLTVFIRAHEDNRGQIK